MYREISTEFGGEFLGDVELGTRVMAEFMLQEVFGIHMTLAIADAEWLL